MVPSSFPLGEIIQNRDANGRIVKWSVELGEFEIEFCLQASNQVADPHKLCV
jgi:hypothetical protein